MHCRNIAAEGEEPKYFTGFQFVDEEDNATGEALDNAG